MLNKSANIILAGGCFWCLESIFVLFKGINKVTPGYIGGSSINPNYNEVCSGTSGHAEAVKIEFDENKITKKFILEVFFVIHDPTQLNRQGNDIGTQYRSVIYCLNDKQLITARESKVKFNNELKQSGFSKITTEIDINQACYAAEEYHQQYLAKNPNGYCGIKGTGCMLPPL